MTYRFVVRSAFVGVGFAEPIGPVGEGEGDTSPIGATGGLLGEPSGECGSRTPAHAEVREAGMMHYT